VKKKDFIINKHIYNIFSVCEDFRQRLEQLNRLKEKGPKDTSKEDK
jgi:hypothetical protein